MGEGALFMGRRRVRSSIYGKKKGEELYLWEGEG